MRKFMEKCEKRLKTYFNFFQDFDFIKEVSKANKTDLKIVFIFEDDKIILILPLEIKKYCFLEFFSGQEQDIQIFVMQFFF